MALNQNFPTKPTVAAPPKPSLAERLAAIPQVTAGNSNLVTLLKGVSGSAKTEGLLSFPQPIFVVHTDRNSETIRKAKLRGVEIDARAIDNWNEYENIILPAIVARELNAATIGVDTASGLFDLMWRHIQGSQPRKLDFDDFRRGLSLASSTMFDLCSTAQPARTEGKPSYHVVCTSHLTDVTNDQGSLIKVVPKLMGAFKDSFENYFDYVFLCEAMLTSTQVKEGERTVMRPAKQFRIHTVPPANYHTCKGGGMPPTIDVPEGKGLFELIWPLIRPNAPSTTNEEPNK